LRIYILIFFFLALFSGMALGDTAVGDTANINRLNKAAAAHFRSDPDSTFQLAKQSIALSRKTGYAQGLADGLVQEGHANYFKGKSADAIKDFDEAIGIYKNLNDQYCRPLNRGVQNPLSCWHAGSGVLHYMDNWGCGKLDYEQPARFEYLL